MRNDKKTELQAQKRLETLDEISKLSEMTKNRAILNGLEFIRLGLVKKWSEKRTNDNTLEQKSAAYHAAQKRTMAGKNKSSRWTKDDELFVINSELKDEEIALILGRTINSVWHKRRRLMKSPNAELRPLDAALCGKSRLE